MPVRQISRVSVVVLHFKCGLRGPLLAFPVQQQQSSHAANIIYWKCSFYTMTSLPLLCSHNTVCFTRPVAFSKHFPIVCRTTLHFAFQLRLTQKPMWYNRLLRVTGIERVWHMWHMSVINSAILKDAVRCSGFVWNMRVCFSLFVKSKSVKKKPVHRNCSIAVLFVWLFVHTLYRKGHGGTLVPLTIH